MSGYQPQPDLAAWIRAARRHAGLSQVELAEHLGIAQSSVSQWEKGVTLPSTRHMLGLLQRFPASVADLLTGQPIDDAPASQQGA